jgi:hypothetical protein
MPAPATTLVSPSALAITEALKTCPRALALLQGVPKSELVLTQLWTIAHAIDDETACSFENMDKSEDSAVDAIDAGIAALCAAGTLSFDETVGSRSTPCASMREVAGPRRSPRWQLALASSCPRPISPPRSTGAQ